MSEASYESWGRRRAGRARPAIAADGTFPAIRSAGGLLPFGNGRSYGDSCHNDEGLLVDMRRRSRILVFDADTGAFEAEAGILLSEITRHVAPHGWFPAVTPGTQFVTLGGCIANDVHGKNHHRRGTFGRWVTGLRLLRSDEGALDLAPGDPLFAATIGGMGLTGLIDTARIQLLKIASTTIRETTTRFERLADYFDLADGADARHEYAVAWIDSLATGARAGRGHLICGDHSGDGERMGEARAPLASVPIVPPVSPLRGLALRAFNEAYYRKAKAGTQTRTVPFDAFFYPLDRIGDWNRLYGPGGLHQHQSVVPSATARSAVPALIDAAKRHRHGSFLTVLKRFSALGSAGIIGFAREGYTLTLDFPHRGEATLDLLAELDAITVAAGGAVNPYKDARMSPQTFDASFPQWREVEALRDPAIVSDFWRRTALALAEAPDAPAARPSDPVYREAAFRDGNAELYGIEGAPS